MTTISYVHSICVHNDAISNAIRDEMRWLSATGHDVRLFSYACDYNDFPHTIVKEARDVVFDPHFQTSELIVFHFGVTYPLFDLFPVTPKRSRRLVVFHNVTPRELMSPSALEIVEKSFGQITNIAFADHVVCDSNINLEVLRHLGVTTPACVLPLAVHGPREMAPAKPSAKDRIVRTAFIGRLVRSKGPGDLLTAIGEVLRRQKTVTLNVDFIAKVAFSDPVVVDELRDQAAGMQDQFGNRLKVSILDNMPERDKQLILLDADLFVLPSYHEGFCVPIPEALSSGCKVITYDNSNIPSISGGFATLVKTGDTSALAEAIEHQLIAVLRDAWHAPGGGGYAKYAKETWQYTRQFTPDATKVRFLAAANELLKRPWIERVR